MAATIRLATVPNVAYPTSATFQLGTADAAVSVAQILRVQSVIAGTAAANGANWTLIGALPTGTGTSGDLIFQTGVKTGSGTTQGTATTALTIKGESQSVVIGTAALNVGATGGFLYITTCAGTPNGTPTAFTGRVAIVYDTTAHALWVYDGAWLQPKTPAAAALITWQ